MTVPDYTHLRELAAVPASVHVSDGDWYTVKELVEDDGFPGPDARFMEALTPRVVLSLLDRLEALEKVRADAERYRAFRDRMAQVYGDQPARGFHVEAPTRQELDESWDALSQSLAAARSAK